ELPFESNRWYQVRIECRDDELMCYVDDVLVHHVHLRPIPALMAGTVLDQQNQRLYLKVVNTTYHEEKCEIRLKGFSVGSQAEVIQLAGNPEDRNSLDQPETIAPKRFTHTFSLGGPMIYRFPPNSITLMSLKLE
ncbi:MAG: alpha-L-arabinofuranosidase C-terminal domain-containing protein, partial [Parabacteroides sp.]